MALIAILIVGGALWLGEPFALWLSAHVPAAWAVPAYQHGAWWLFLASIACVLFLGLARRSTSRNVSGLWATPFVRMLVGNAASAALYVALAGTVSSIIFDATQSPLLSFLSLLGCAWQLRRVKTVIGRASRPVGRFLRHRVVGFGGSARLSGLLDDWANPWTPGQILLGTSLYDSSWRVGIRDDRHMLTISSNRGGKGRACIVGNLLTWNSSAIIVDPKGQNAAITAAARGNGGGRIRKPLGHAVRIIDPLGETVGQPTEAFRACFNPLADLDPAAADYVDRIDFISDALVVPSGGKNDFWDQSARTLINGLIDYLVRSRDVADHNRHLGTLRRLLVQPEGPPVDGMAEMDGLAFSAAGLMSQADERLLGNIISTALAHTKWLDSAGMVATLSTSSFSLRDLNDGRTTVYLVLPPQYLGVHGRFLRLFVNLALQAVAENKSGNRTLFVLDEFYALGHLEQLVKAAGVLAGYGVKLWPIVQNLTQLQELYPQNWEAFVANAGQVQLFAMNDQTTAAYASTRLGRRVLWQQQNGPNGVEMRPAAAVSLRDAQEIAYATSRESGNQIVLTAEGDALLLRRANYDKTFPKDAYMPDPFVPASSRRFMPATVKAAVALCKAAATNILKWKGKVL